MKPIIPLLLLFMLPIIGKAQYYLRGEVKDEGGRLLEDVAIYLHSKGTVPFRTGQSGSFGIPSNKALDTILLSKDGFQHLKLAVQTSKFQTFVLRKEGADSNSHKNRLSSRIRNKQEAKEYRLTAHGETYNTLVENGFVAAGNFPETGFALNVDRAAYSNVRRFLNLGNNVPPDAVRIEEMLNYFSLNDDVQRKEKQFVLRSALTTCPWNADNRLLILNMIAPSLDMSSVPPSNFVFLIDVSGSMDKPNRLPLVQSALKLLVKNLRGQDTVSIVIYGGTIGVFMPPTSGAEKDKIVKAIESLAAGGDTNGHGALKLAYNVAKQTFIEGGNNRVILATDGDFNVGQVTEKDLEDLIVGQRNSGIYLTCLGVGMGNYKDSKLETLAKKGNGNFAYLDSYKEAEKVMVQEFSKTMYAVATDAYVTMNFNPAVVKDYRLIGYDNRQEALGDAHAEIEGGEIGSGHNATAVFELTLQPDAGNDVGKLMLNYNEPVSKANHRLQFAIENQLVPLAKLKPECRLHIALAMFGSLVKRSPFALGKFQWDDVAALASTAVQPSDPLQMEFMGLIEKARKIYGNGKR